MNILVTSATSRIGRAVADALAGTHEVTRTDLPDHGGGKDGVIASDLNHDEATDDLVRGMDAVVHPGFGAHSGDAAWLIDFHTRRSYNLLRACVDQGVPGAIYLSTLRLLEPYPERLTVSERWKPLPSTDDEILAVHLGEYTFREYAREEPISTTILRLGFPVLDGTGADAEASGETAALAGDDLGTAVNAAISAELTGYRVLHVQSPVSNARYLMGAAEMAIGYPQSRESLAGEGAAR
jgi:uronate dehydrogenase